LTAWLELLGSTDLTRLRTSTLSVSSVIVVREFSHAAFTSPVLSFRKNPCRQVLLLLERMGRAVTTFLAAQRFRTVVSVNRRALKGRRSIRKEDGDPLTMAAGRLIYGHGSIGSTFTRLACTVPQND